MPDLPTDLPAGDGAGAAAPSHLPAMERLVLVRYGELALKKGNRALFEERLRAECRRAVAEFGAPPVRRTHGRFFVELGPGGAGGAWRVAERLARVFGVVGVHPAVRVKNDLDAICAAAGVVLSEALERPDALERRGAGVPVAAAGERIPFRVSAHRAHKGFPHDSVTVNRVVGRYLLTRHPELTVDLERAAVDVAVEIRHDAAYCYAGGLAGPGGLPLGVSGRGLVLLSGGIDSPVAAWLAMKRGLRVDAVHFHTPPFTSERSRDKVLDLCRILARWSGVFVCHVVHFTEVQQAIYTDCPPDLGVTLMRRMMFRVADRLAGRLRAGALVTGESLGQVASQTLESLAVIEAVAQRPVLRPLITLDKTEIMALAGRIETLETSNRPYEDCCALFVPRHPRIRPRPGPVEAAERALDVDGLVRRALEGIETFECGPAPG